MDVKPQRYYRRVIRIRAEDSPNVRLGLAQVAAGMAPTDEVLVPGVLRYSDYVKRRKMWDPIRQTVGLDAQFHKGKGVMLYPPEWLAVSNTIADGLVGRRRQALGVGIDPAEGGDETSLTAVDDLGFMESENVQTPDTDKIVGRAMAFCKRLGVPGESVCIDRGGGGKQLADRMRALDFPVRTVAFGEGISLEPRRGLHQLASRLEVREAKCAYKNRRAQMYGEARILIDPSGGGYGIPASEAELLRQLGLMPLMYDEEGALMMLPKNKRDPNSRQKTLTELLGCSPDRADSFVLALHAILHEPAGGASAGAF